jgi:hypothetical protein
MGTKYYNLHNIGDHVFAWADRGIDVPAYLPHIPNYDYDNNACPICGEITWVAESMDYDTCGCYKSTYCIKCRIYWVAHRLVCPICSKWIIFEHDECQCKDCGTWEVDKLLDALEFGD